MTNGSILQSEKIQTEDTPMFQVIPSPHRREKTRW